jgi:type IV pilus assembly protein PilE
MTIHLRGFSLFEIMIVLVLISILASFTYPIFTSHLLTAHRLQAVNVLSQLETALTVFQFEHQTYEGATLENLSVSSRAISDYYRISIRTTTDDYVIIADPINQQQKDELCGSLSVNEAGDKVISGSGSIESCW